MIYNFDFADLSKKREGKKLISEQLELPIPTATATSSNFLSLFNGYIEQLPQEKRHALYGLKPDGVGPGELACYFLFDNIFVGGRSASIDLFDGNVPFAEVKGGKVLKGDQNSCRDFKITTDSDPAVRQLMNGLEEFNATYREITGHNLPEWRGPEEIKILNVIDYSKINLVKLAKSSVAQGSLQLHMDRTNFLQGGNIRNVTYNGKILKGITGSTTVDDLLRATSQVSVNKEIATIDKIVSRWAKAACSGYLDKNICLMDNTNKRMKYFGKIAPEMISLQYTHRQQPWAIIHVNKEDKNG